MIRKVIIVVLTLGAVGTGVAWVGSYPGLYFAHVTYMAPGKSPLPARSVRFLDGTLSRGGFHFESHSAPPTAIDGEDERKFREEYPPGWHLAVHGQPSMHSLIYLMMYLDFAGTRTASVSTPLWFTTLVFATYPTIAFIRGPLRRWRRRRKGLCLKCGYDLTGNESGVCSECGTEVESP